MLTVHLSKIEINCKLNIFNSFRNLDTSSYFFNEFLKKNVNVNI